MSTVRDLIDWLVVLLMVPVAVLILTLIVLVGIADHLLARRQHV